MKSAPLGVICPCFEDATSFYRASGPFAALHKNVPDFQYKKIDPNLGINWEKLVGHSGVFFQRPFLPAHVEACKMIKSLNMPLWLDYDDDLLDVMTDNPTWKVYGKESTKNQVIECLAYADIITFSTMQLRAKFEAALRKAKPNLSVPEMRVIPNAFNNSVFRYEEGSQRDNFIMWRGSETHVRDIFTYTPEMIDVSNKNDQWTWLFLGQYPWMMVDHVPPNRMIYNDHVDPIQYFKLIQELRPSIFIVPLRDHPFNHSKSNIAWIEATYAGAAVLAPDWHEWRKPGVTVYKNREDFKAGLEFLINSKPGFREALAKTSWNYIQQELMLDKVNKLRLDIVMKYFQG